MGNPCRVCKHPDRDKIENDRLLGESLRSVGKKHNVCYVGIHRHFKAGHVKKKKSDGEG